MTSFGSPRPIRVLTSALVVEPNALIVTKRIDERLRTMFEMASCRSPRCSTARKKRNQVAVEMNACIMVQIETLKIRPSSRKFTPRKRNSL